MDLKERRLQLGLTLEEVGKMVGVGKSTVRKWENGVIGNMGRDKISRLAEALRVSPLFIMNIDDDDNTKYILDTDDIYSIYHSLSPRGQRRVYRFAELELNNENKAASSVNISEDGASEVYTLAAHSDDPNKKVTKKDLENINSYLDELDADYNKKKRNK